MKAAAAVAGLAAVTAALPAVEALLPAVGVAASTLTTSLAAAASTIGALGYLAPAAIAAAVLANAARKIKRSHAGILVCRDRAGLRAFELGAGGRYAVRLSDLPTASDAECWHRGLKTSDRKNGRTSERVPTTVIRADVLPAAGGGAAGGLAVAVLGRPLARGELLCVPFLGPWSFSRYGYPAYLDLAGYTPTGTAAALALTEAYLRGGNLPREQRVIAARVAKAAIGWVAGITSADDLPPRPRPELLPLVQLAASLALGYTA